MKGLIYKDLQIMKNNAKLMLGVFIIACAFIFVNGSDGSNSSFLVIYMGFMSAIMALNTLGYDDMNHGMSYILTLPVKRSTYAKEKYVFALLFGFCIGLLALPAGAVLCMRQGNPDWTEFFVSCVISFVLICVMVALMIPVQLKFGGENGRVAIISVIFVIVLVGYGIDYIAKSFGIELLAVFEELASANIAVTALTGFAAVVIVLLISLSISIMIINKKEY